MRDAYYYQRKYKAENKKNKPPKKPVSEDAIMAGILITLLLAIVVTLFVMLWHALEGARNECESLGGEYHSTYVGQVLITRCDGV